MKILHSELQEVCGGIESFLINISNEMDINAIQFEYLMRGTNEQIAGNVKGVVHRVPDNRIKYIFFVISFLRNNKFDMIHLHKNSAADIVLPILIRIFSRDSYVIVHSHNSQPSSSSGILKILHRLNRAILYCIADAAFACSDVAAEWMFGKKGRTGQVKLIKNGIQIQKYVFNREIRKKIRDQYKISDTTFLIGNVGRLSKQKNQIFLISILAEVIKKGYSVKLIICGEGEEKQAIVEEAEKLQVQNNVILPGACSNINEILQAMDVFVMPSLYEGLTIAAIEAQCAGLPCVFSDTMSEETILSHHCHVLSLRDGAEKWSDAICNSFDVVRTNMTDVIRNSGYDNKETAQVLTDFYNEVYETGRADSHKSTLPGVGFAVLATFLARSVGFLREVFVANVFGTSAFGDSFIVAFSIPDILADGFSYAVAQLYIPTYFKMKREKNSVDEESKFNKGTLSFVILTGFLIVTVVECFPEIFTKLFASGFSGDTLQLTVKMLRIMILSVPLICVAALFKAYGQIIKKFGLFVSLGIIINTTIITALIIYQSLNINILPMSVVLGNLLYVLAMFIIIRQNNYVLSPGICLKNPYLQGMVWGILPVFASNIISEINQIIDKNFASRLAVGTVSSLNYSSKIINLITAILGTAIVSVLFADLSRLAMENKKERLAKEALKICSCVLTVTVPFFYLFLFGATPIIRTLFERGNFDKVSVNMTSECLAFYSIGVIGFNVKAVWIRVYNASLDTKTPAINAAFTVAVNVMLNVLLINILQHKGLALATGISSIISDVFLILNYNRLNPCFHKLSLVKEVLWIGLISMSYIPFYLIFHSIGTELLIVEIIRLIVAFLSGTVLYMILLSKTNTIIGKEIRRVKGLLLSGNR